MNKFILTKQNFAAWLKAHATDAFEVADAQFCPLACYLSHATGQPAKALHARLEIKGRRRQTPLWASQFIVRVDETKTHRILGEYALALLEVGK